MQRRFLLKLGALAPAAFFGSQYLSARPGSVAPINVAATATELNALAANVHSQDDARRLVDFVADLCADQTPPAWRSNPLRQRIALAEFASATNPAAHIPETRLANAWNAFVETLKAPADSQVTAAEIHNSRDALFTMAQVSWNMGGRNFWAVPFIFATEPDGTLAPGCRAIESIRILWDLANMPENLRSARARVKQGKLFSSEFPHPETYKTSSVTYSVHGKVRTEADPIQLAQKQYVRTSGASAFNYAVLKLLRDILA